MAGIWMGEIMFFMWIQFCRLEISFKSGRISGIASKISSQKIIDIEHFIVNLCFNT